MQLKAYQQRALDALSGFLTDCRTDGVLSAWQTAMQIQQRHNVYQAQAFGEPVPCVCLRLPTGGGKTLLASYALALTGKQWQDTSKRCNGQTAVADNACLSWQKNKMCKDEM